MTIDENRAREVRDPLIHAVASLRAAISLLERGGKKAAPSDKMFAQMLKDYRRAADNAASALTARQDAATDALTWFGTQRRLLLDFYSPMYGDDDDQSEEWRVTKESGPINDREWNVIGRGDTPLAAINAARAALTTPKPDAGCRREQMSLDLYDLRRREVQAIGAAISTRDWWALEQAYNSLRDKLDRAGYHVGATPKPDASQGEALATQENNHAG